MNSSESYLVTYRTNAGSTADVAERIGKRIRETGAKVSVVPLREADDLSAYTTIIIGAPMIIGWDRRAVRFVKKNAGILSQKTVHVFMTAMKVTAVNDEQEMRVSVDPKILEPAADPHKLTFAEKHTTVDHYIAPVINRRDGVSPSSVALMAGKLDYTKLKFPQNLFVMLVIGARPGDKRNWDLIDQWSDEIVDKKEN